ncbi:PAS domain-containing sensor histidine kinase [Archangium sp.]|uniref:PAS domain-containing sensor histidine kinase n=1 Tax=Archangium sp. TaxID=1872627 RepID=UPI00286D3125|nr:PAS domain-containing sensor histidine kinase [Archangium sp.]
MLPPSSPDFQQLFEQSPGCLLVLMPDADFTIVAVSDAYLRATKTTREGLLGRALFEMFPDNPADPKATGSHSVRASFERVLATRAPDTIGVLQYDLRLPKAEGGGFETRYWSTTNVPVLSSEGQVRYLIHRTEDVTDFVLLTESLQGQDTAGEKAEVLRRGQEVLQATNRELREAVRARDESLALAARARAEAERQRAWLHSLFMQAPNAITILRGPRYVVELANPLVCRIWGRRPEQVLGKPLFEALPEVVNQGLEELLAQVLTTGVPYVGRELPVRLARLEGGAIEDVYFNFVYEPMRDSQGQVEGIIVVASDVTELVRARQRTEALAAQEVHAAEERLRLAMEAMKMGTWDMDLTTCSVVWDGRMRALFGLSADAPVDYALLLSRVHSEDRDRVDLLARAALTPGSGGTLAIEYRTAPQDGAPERWVSTQGQVHFDASGRPTRMLGTGLDITARKALEQETKARTDFEQQLIGIVSHDLRNPLSAILLGTQALLRQEGLEERQLKSVVRIQSSAERAVRMVKDLLDFTQARLGGGLRMERRPLELAPLISQLVLESEAAHPERTIEVRHGGDTRGEWDGDRIAQVVTNLVTNALKYSPPESPVRVEARGVDGWVSLAVHNRGPPIPRDKWPLLFKPLQRARGEVDRAGRSVGLGLYIVDHITRAHGGRVEMRSTEADGTTFTVWLPRSVSATRN